jgi:thymidylate synthase (FAD)
MMGHPNSEDMTTVLDHGFVNLIDHMGNDQRIAEAARVIAPAEWRGAEDVKLINYMMKHGHTSPFEHVTFTFHVKAPIFVYRQWHRHRTWSFNEVSARYKALSAEYYVPKPEHVGSQSLNNHQSREMGWQATDYGTARCLSIDNACKFSFEVYNQLLDDSMPREIARGVLPFNTYSEMYATVDLHNLLHFLRLRLDQHAQYEIRVYAEAILDLIRAVVPETVTAWYVHEFGTARIQKADIRRMLAILYDNSIDIPVDDFIAQLEKLLG